MVHNGDTKTTKLKQSPLDTNKAPPCRTKWAVSANAAMSAAPSLPLYSSVNSVNNPNRPPNLSKPNIWTTHITSLRHDIH